MTPDQSRAVVDSLELVAELDTDPTAQVYQRLFAENPEMETLFIRDRDGSVRGQMLHQMLEAILDFTGPQSFGLNMLRSEIVNHENLGVPPEVFVSFFDVVHRVLSDIGADQWTPAMTSGWNGMIDDLTARL